MRPKLITNKKLKDAICTPIVSNAIVSSEGIANGRGIPVVVVAPDENHIIDNIISTHQSIPSGHVSSQWASSVDQSTIYLILDFSDPVANKVIIAFDIIKYGIIVDQIIFSQCLYLMTGTPGMHFSENTEKPRIILEVPSEDFKDSWGKIYKEKYSGFLQKKYHISQKKAKNIFDEMQKELNELKTLRMK